MRFSVGIHIGLAVLSAIGSGAASVHAAVRQRPKPTSVVVVGATVIDCATIASGQPAVTPQGCGQPARPREILTGCSAPAAPGCEPMEAMRDERTTSSIDYWYF